MTTYYGIKDGEEYKPWLWSLSSAQYAGKHGLTRRDGLAKCNGTAVYARDFQMAGALCAKSMEAPYAHAKILSMDTARAATVPGVRKIIKYDDPPIGVASFDGQRYPGALPTLPSENWWAGEICGAIVVADNEMACDEALKILYQDTEWEKLPFHLDCERALASDAAVIYPDLLKNNIYDEEIEEYGDVDSALQSSPNTIDVVIRQTADSAAVVQGACDFVKYLHDDEIEYWGNHETHFLFTSYTPVFLPWIKRVTGHGFVNAGVFGHVWGGLANHLMAARAAKETNGRPVKHLFDSAFYWLGDEVGTYKATIGYKDNGEVTAVKYHHINTGALADQLTQIRQSCKCENIYSKKTFPCQNLGAYHCYRHGANMVLTHVETFNQVANELKMDPTQVALINDGSLGHDMAWITENIKKVQGFDASRDSLKECLAIGKEAIGWDTKWHQPGIKKLENGSYHGIGFVWSHTWYHRPNDSNEPDDLKNRLPWGPLGLAVDAFGKVIVLGDNVEQGVNRDTTYASIIADEMGMKLEDVAFKFANEPAEQRTPFDFHSHADSRGMTTNSTMLGRLGKKAKDMVLSFAMQPRVIAGGWGGITPGNYPPLFPNKQPEELDIKDSVIYEIANPANQATVADLAAVFHTKMFVWDMVPDIDPELQTFSMGRQCHFMEVEVDPETGKVKVEKLVIVNDAGRLISPETYAGQQYGGAYMGFGRSTFEEVIFDPTDGVRLNDDLISYPVPVMNDIEGPIVCHQIETGLGYAAYGMIGVGENIGACVANLSRYAVHNAIGKWVDLCTSPKKILEALGKG
ncbi:MAG: molybdopterin-dependent oxidoreductase [Dehalococcoidia bacterium]|nr:molybdopterin-dependent oxidoreductase [Dehalococcoidia bacterium]